MWPAQARPGARVQPRAGTDPKGIKLKVTPPGGAAKTVTTDEHGAIDLSGAVPALAGTSPIGTWHIELTGGGPVLEDGAVQPSRIAPPTAPAGRPQW